MKPHLSTRLLLVIGLGASIAAPLASVPASAAPANAYVVHDLVSDGAHSADTTDPNLVNAWGLTAGPTTPWWVADNGTDLSTLYNAAGVKIGLEVQVDGGPTGATFNGTPHFVVSDGTASGPALFLFASVFPEERAFTRTEIALPGRFWVLGFGTWVFAPHVFHFGITLAKNVSHGRFRFIGDRGLPIDLRDKYAEISHRQIHITGNKNRLAA